MSTESTQERREARIENMYENLKAVLTRMLDSFDDLSQTQDDVRDDLSSEMVTGIDVFENLINIPKGFKHAISKPAFNLMKPIYKHIRIYRKICKSDYSDEEFLEDLKRDIIAEIYEALNQIAEVEYAEELKRELEIQRAGLPYANEAITLAAKQGLLATLRKRFARKEAMQEKIQKSPQIEPGDNDSSI